MKKIRENLTPTNALAIAVLFLIIVWPINGTTGLKNLLILVSATASVYLLFNQINSIKILSNPRLIPLFLFFLWILFQSYFISPFPEQAQKQLLSVWLATALSALIGIVLGFLNTKKYTESIVNLALLSLPFIYFINYLLVCALNNNFTIPIFDTNLGFYGDKTKIIFFGLISLATSLHLLFKSIQKKEKRNSLLFASCALASYLSFILVGSKSGVMQGVILFFFALLFVVRHRISKQASTALVTLGLLFCAAGVWQMKNDTGWANFLQSIEAGIDIDRFDNWKNYPENGLPLVDGKYQTQESAYLRANGIMLGVKCLITQPLGHGNLSEPLKRTRNTCKLATETSLFTTLSAILDFSLVIGIPGIIIFLTIFYTAFSNQGTHNDPLPLNNIVPLSIILTWIFSEISDTHYYESTFFILSMLISNQRFILINEGDAAAAG